jgi:hypothetical protein
MTTPHESIPQHEQEEASPLAKEALFDRVSSLSEEQLSKKDWTDEYGRPISFTYATHRGLEKDAQTTITHVGIHIDATKARFQANREGELEDSDQQADYYYHVGKDQSGNIDLYRSTPVTIKLVHGQSVRPPEPIKQPVSENDAWRLVHTISTMKQKTV